MDNTGNILSPVTDPSIPVGMMVLLLPLVSFILINLLGGKKGLGSGWLGSAIMTLTFFLSVYLFIQIWNNDPVHYSFSWINSVEPMNFRLGINLDNVTVLTLLVVSLISCLIHFYSIDYMKGEEHFHRYFSYLGFFTFSMFGIVMADNLLMVFIFWELVGFSSWLLIGFWFHKTSAARAAKKAFVVNRIGDLGFLAGIMILWSYTGTLDYIELQGKISDLYYQSGDSAGTGMPDLKWLFFAGLGLFSGAIGKSAQFPLLVWLPDAMEGPTPVSALIHAATMVAAGVYLMARVFFMLTLPVLSLIAITGAITAFLAAVAALTQYDIKKVLAYSTISQLGLMMLGLGVGAREAALFHLFTHAFFKAGLFLAAGMIIKSLHDLEIASGQQGNRFDPQDLRNMGGLRNKMPAVFFSFIFCSAALAGIPLFSGFLSKDAILNGAIGWASDFGEQGWGMAWIIPITALLSAFITVIYTLRLLILVFYGELRWVKYNPPLAGVELKLKQRPLVASIPVIGLGVFSFGMIFSYHPFNAAVSWVVKGITSSAASYTFSLVFLNHLRQISEKFHGQTILLSLGLVVAGVFTAWFFYLRKNRYTDQVYQRPLPEGFLGKLSYHAWYLDALYKKIFLQPFMWLSSVFGWIDNKIIDRLIDLAGMGTVVMAHVVGWMDRFFVDGLVNLTAAITRTAGQVIRSAQSGRVQSYYLWTLFLILVIIFWWVI